MSQLNEPVINFIIRNKYVFKIHKKTFISYICNTTSLDNAPVVRLLDCWTTNSDGEYWL